MAAWFMFSTIEESRRSSVIYKSQALYGLDALQLLLVMWHGHQPCRCPICQVYEIFHVS